jgi:hypothetical protein
MVQSVAIAEQTPPQGPLGSRAHSCSMHVAVRGSLLVGAAVMTSSFSGRSRPPEGYLRRSKAVIALQWMRGRKSAKVTSSTYSDSFDDDFDAVAAVNVKTIVLQHN